MADPYVLECTYCSTDTNYPYGSDKEGEGPLCVDCYTQEFEFICDFCENYGHNSIKRRVLAVCAHHGRYLSKPFEEVPSGVYLVDKAPNGEHYLTHRFYLDGLHFESEHLTRVADLPAEQANAHKSILRLCSECQKPYLNMGEQDTKKVKVTSVITKVVEDEFVVDAYAQEREIEARAKVRMQAKSSGEEFGQQIKSVETLESDLTPSLT